MTNSSEALTGHPVRRNGFLRPDAPSFQPATTTAPALGRKSIPCRFFLSGKCTKGENCAFGHEALRQIAPFGSEPPKVAHKGLVRARIGVSDDSHGVEQVVAQTDSASRKELKRGDALERFAKDLSGALVRFGPGAEVTGVTFASDFSAIQLFGLPIGARAEVVVRLLEDLGYTVSQSCVQLKSLGNAGLVAEVKIEDPKFAKTATSKFDEESRRGRHQGLSIKPASGDVGPGSLVNKLRMSSVICTWYAASRVAWLQYHDPVSASTAQEFLNANPKILNRKIECSIQCPPPYARRDLIWSVQVGNLDALTRQSHFERILTGYMKPLKIVLGRPSHSLSEIESANTVEAELRGKGDLESFQFHSTPGSVKLKATATFMDRDQAVEAVRSLNNHKLEKLGNSKLFVSHLISVKYRVLNVIYDSIIPDLARLRDAIWQSGHIHLKSYPSTDITKPLTTLRIFGEDSKHVAEAKGALEKLLAGSVVMNGETTVWDPFFATPQAVDYLKQKSGEHKLYIHRDIRQSFLLIYGGLVNDQAAAKQSLIAQVESLKQLTHTIVLTSELLHKAMKGGWRRVKEKFGEAAVFDISRQPKTILIRGSAQDVQQAQTLLQNHSAAVEAEISQGDNICPVCWEEATEPLKMLCSHNYCKDCFGLQVSSADESSFPIRCCGAEGKCPCIFSMDELKTMLSPGTFEKLLATSFDAFVRTHPQDFQHCPTPDCPHIYRISNDGSVLLCSACLTPICTTCNVINHDGMSCAEFKDLSSEGTKAFEKWKRENDVRNCPKCSSPIEKNFGCNHMVCFRCKAHICWFCMRVFDESGACYRHMETEHRQIYPD